MKVFRNLHYLTVQTFKRGKVKPNCSQVNIGFIPSYLQRFLSHDSPTFDTKAVISTSTSALFQKLQEGERSALARAITLVESQHPQKQASAQSLLSMVLKDLKKRFEKFGHQSLSFRIGLTGPPGAGKSTFIETLGKLLTAQGYKVAVLAVDPSSSTTGGSLLGDKTRMQELSADINAFIRPSPASGCLGGVTRSTNEAIALCECAGYDIIIVETVGVGQSEYHVASMVDMFVMIVSPAGGDELQGLKKGIVELVDLVVVNKADGELIPSARRIQADYISALKFVRARYKIWRPNVLCVSSRTRDGIPELWEEMQDFKNIMFETGDFVKKRKQQYKMWMWTLIEYNLLNAFKKHPQVKSLVSDTESRVENGIITPGQASDVLLKKFLGTD